MTKRSYLRHLVTSIWYAMDERNIGIVSAGVAFYIMFAIFPGMAATIAIWGFFSDPSVMRDYLDQIHGVIPDAAYNLIETQLSALLRANISSVGWTTTISIGIALYSVHNGVAALISGLNAVHARPPHPGIWRYVGSLLMTLSVIAVGLAALSVVVLVPVVLNFMELGPSEELILKNLPWFVLFVVLFVVLGLFYRWGPNVGGRDERHKWITPGAFLAATLWVGTSIAFSVYLTYFGAYNRIYGSIGAVIALLMWLYLTAYIILLGGILNAERARILRSARLPAAVHP